MQAVAGERSHMDRITLMIVVAALLLGMALGAGLVMILQNDASGSSLDRASADSRQRMASVDTAGSDSGAVLRPADGLQRVGSWAVISSTDGSRISVADGLQRIGSWTAVPVSRSYTSEELILEGLRRVGSWTTD